MTDLRRLVRERARLFHEQQRRRETPSLPAHRPSATSTAALATKAVFSASEEAEDAAAAEQRLSRSKRAPPSLKDTDEAAPSKRAKLSPAPLTSSDASVDPLDAFMSTLATAATPAEAPSEEKTAHVATASSMSSSPVIASKPATGESSRSTGASSSTSSSSSSPPPPPPAPPAGVSSLRGPAVLERYYGDEEGAFDEDELDVLARDALDDPKAKLKKKELHAVNHSTFPYIAIRKAFWMESREVAQLSEEEVDERRRTVLEGVKTRGKHVPRPFFEWSQCGLSGKVAEVIAACGYARPFPVQSVAIPVIMSGRDCIACAKTGSGKTLAFVLPLLRHALDQPPVEPGKGPIGLILAPTRELAVQIYAECRRFAKAVGLRVVCVYGGSGVAEQIASLKRGSDVIVATPGRLIDMLCANNGRVLSLDRVSYAVLDEADRMFDLGFEPQIAKVLELIRPDRQLVMFSATFPSSVEKLARRTLKDGVEIVIGGRSVASTSVTQYVEVRKAEDKFPRLLEILGKWSAQHHTRSCIRIAHART